MLDRLAKSERNRVELEIRVAVMALEDYRKALEIANQLD